MKKLSILTLGSFLFLFSFFSLMSVTNLANAHGSNDQMIFADSPGNPSISQEDFTKFHEEMFRLMDKYDMKMPCMMGEGMGMMGNRMMGQKMGMNMKNKMKMKKIRKGMEDTSLPEDLA